MDFGRIAAILRRRILLLLSCIFVTMALTWGMTRLTGSRWLATVTFLVPSETPLTNATKDKSETPILDAKGQATVFAAIAKSPDVLENALQKVKIAPPRDLIKHIEFEATGSRLYELKVTDSNPSRAEQLANAIAESFYEANKRINTQNARNQVTLLEGQLRERDAALEKVRKEYVDYCEKNGIKGESASGQLVMAQRQMEASQQSYEQVKDHIDSNTTRLRSLQAQLGKLPAEIETKLPVTQRGDIFAADRNLADAKQQLAKVRQKYTEANPAVKEARETVAQAETDYNNALNKRLTTLTPNAYVTSVDTEVKNLQAQIEADKTTLANMQTNVGEASKEINRLSKASSPLGSLATAVATETDLRTAMFSRVHAAKMQLDVAEQQSPLVILERVNASNPPVNSSAGRTLKLMILAALCAAIVLSGILIALESGDNRLKSIEAAETLLGVPVLASVPPPQGAVSALSLVRAAELHPLSQHAEAFRFLGHHFLHTRHGQAPPRSIMTLSAKSKQGNTNTAVNLAITLAQAGHRVILVDGNTRTPSLHEIFELDNETGLTTVLANPNEGAISAALRPTGMTNLLVLPSGPPSENPWELFSTQSVQALSSNLLGRADYVIYDTPSALAYTDAMNLGEIADTALMCIRVTDRLSGQEARVVQMFQMQGVHVMGSVLKDVPLSFVQDNQRSTVVEAPRAVEATQELMPTYAIEAAHSAHSDLPVPHVSTVAPTASAHTEPITPIAVATPTAAPLTADDLRTILAETLREQANPTPKTAEMVEPVADSKHFSDSEVVSSPIRAEMPFESVGDEEKVMSSQFTVPEVNSPYTPPTFTVAPVDDVMRSRVQEALNRVEVLERQLAERNLQNDRLSSETKRLNEDLTTAQKRLAEIEVRESAAASTIMQTEQNRVSVEQELEKAKAAAQAEAEQIRVAARQEAEAIVGAARKQLEEAQAIGTAYLTQAEQVKQQAQAEAEHLVQEAHNQATAITAQAQQSAHTETEKARHNALTQAEAIVQEAAHQAEEIHQRLASVYEDHLKTLGDDIMTKLRQSIQTQLAQRPATTGFVPAAPLRNGSNGSNGTNGKPHRRTRSHSGWHCGRSSQ